MLLLYSFIITFVHVTFIARIGYTTAVNWDEDSSTITNNIVWTDKSGEKLKGNRGALISEKINGYWYLVGSQSKPALPECNDIKGGEIYIYKSKNLGSNSWEQVARITERVLDKTGETKPMDAYSCGMNQHPTNKLFYLHCRERYVCTAASPEDFNLPGEYDCGGSLTLPPEENCPPEGCRKRRKGDGHVSFREGEDLYYVTSRVQMKDSKYPKNGNRKLFIYKLNSDWTGIETTTASWIYNKRESPQIVTNDGYYYLFTSETKGFAPSRTQYIRSTTLDGLNPTQNKERKVNMSPKDDLSKGGIVSMGSQFVFITKFGSKWMFGGRRHPIEDPCNMAEKWGSHIMTSFSFNKKGVPKVYWKESFDWKLEKPRRFEKHPVDSYKPDCKDSDAKFCQKKKKEFCGNKYVKPKCF